MVSGVLLAAAVLSVLSLPAWGSVVAKSTISECIAHSGTEMKDSIDASCKKKLVVAMTVSANEGSSQKIEANIARATDATGKNIKNVQLQNPVRIIINKSPVMVNYRLYQVGYVSNYPHEIVRPRQSDRCRDDWFAEDWTITCPFKKNFKNERVFDSQGFCCYCEQGAHFFARGSSVSCAGRNKDQIGHCLIFDEYNYYVFGLYPPDFKFTITITIQRLSYNRQDGEDVWEDVAALEIGPQRRKVTSNAYQIKAEYIADFNPSEFVQTGKLSNRYLLVPDSAILSLRNPLPQVYHGQNHAEHAQFISSFRNASEWMAVPKTMFDLTRTSCDKIGVGYSAFKHQATKCTAKLGSCLRNQPFLLWKEDKDAIHNRRQGQYMLHNFGKVHSMPHTSDITDYQVNFIANRPTKSLIVISLVADDMKVVVHKSPGRIVEAYIESFEALSTTGTLITLVQNTGSFTATYNVFVVHCSAGIDMVPSLSVTLDPNEISNVSFVMHSFHAVGKTNYCTLELNDVNGDLLDNMTVGFETLDTCFCYGYCGCACGDGNTTCPDPPKMDEGDTPYIQNPFPPDWLKNLGTFFKYAAPKFLMTFWILLMLLCLGVIKIVHLLITGDFKFPAAAEPVTMALMIAKQLLEKILKEWFPRAFQACTVCCEKSISCCFASTFCILTAGRSKKDEGLTRKVGIGWRVPRNCNGMCKGAKFARRKHRKLMRINKRKGMKNETAWYQKPYKCTCKVKDNMPCCQIIKGLFFFHYCLFIPLIWVLHYLWLYCKRKWKRRKRKKIFRQSRAERNQEENQAYLQLDKYSRGKIEREIMDLSQDIKTKKQRKLVEQSKGYHPEDEDVITLEPTSHKQETITDPESGSSDEEDKVYASSAGDSSDTSDADEAGSIEELLTPGDPVYFNDPLTNTLPPSIQNPGKMLSVQGRLRPSEKETEVYIFDLHKYTYQVKEVRDGKVCLLNTPKLLTNSKEFEHRLDREKALQLVTIAPLFVCLNDTTTFVMKMQSKTISLSQQ